MTFLDGYKKAFQSTPVDLRRDLTSQERLQEVKGVSKRSDADEATKRNWGEPNPMTNEYGRLGVEKELNIKWNLKTMDGDDVYASFSKADLHF